MTDFRWPHPESALCVVGVMSGTSCDGVDVAVVEVQRAERLRVRTLFAWTQPYSDTVREALLRLASPGTSPEEVCRWNFEVGEQLAEAVLAALARARVQPQRCHLIGSHGHTVWHVPGHSTLQIGEAAVIAERTGLPVVSNFRARDVAAGGQGAPLVPYVDWLLFSHPHRSRAVQNLGGISNVTWLPAGGGPDGVLAFDTGPGNMVVDGVVRLLTGARYDEGGRMAAAGTPHLGLVEELVGHPYFRQPPPKSTGREVFGLDYARGLVERGRQRGLSDADLVATATYLTARTVADAYRFLGKVDEVLLSGGGVHNRTLVRWIQEALAPVPVRTTAGEGVDPDFKEAVAFAVLAAMTAWGMPGNLPSATGARRPVILGDLTLP
ncbi:MAG: anhydro-N-acetylmuramic acid kinase [Armatimonadota bacterium]|nr:anhydro-N-acetylmuramic acid kinase [Armatimonadota bacterium]MDR5689765.1 anhydro-N-acetylmuramic acid kinase [Armatimonadota bacterium]